MTLKGVENQISRSDRLDHGMFFTAEHVVDEICSHFDFSKVESVIDSAAGSGNFLFPLAKRFPEVQFYGIEKHPAIFETAKLLCEAHPNVNYFLGDSITQDFPIPPCDLYLGNPPFINFSDLERSYQEELRPYCRKYMDLPRGFSMLLGNSRSDISQLIFQKTLERYLKPQGKIGVVLPETLLFGASSQFGFQRQSGFLINRLKELPLEDSFHGTQRAAFYLIAEKGISNKEDLKLIRRNGETALIRLGRDGWKLQGDQRGNYPREWLGHYRARQGLNSLGANKIFFFSEKPENLEDELIYPLLKSSDIHSWGSTPSRYCLLPYDNQGKILSEDILQHNYPDIWSYLLSKKDLLKNRKSRFAQRHWYGLFGMGDYCFAPYKVIWRALGAKSMQAAVVEDSMANQAMHGFIPFEEEREAHYICALLNSPQMNQEVLRHCREGSKSFAQPGTLSKLPIPPWKEVDPRQNQLAEISLNFHEDFCSKGVFHEEKVQELSRITEELLNSRSYL